TRTIAVTATLSGRLAVDLNASTGTDVVLTCPVAAAIETTDAETVVTARPSAFDDRGRLVPIPFDTQYSVNRRGAQARLRLVAPLVTAADPATRVVTVRCDLSAAAVAIDSNDSDLQTAMPELERQFTAALRMASQRTSGSDLELCPRLSLVGALRPGESVAEISYQQIRAEVLAAASTNQDPVLAVAIALVGNTRPHGSLENFVGTDDFGVVISGAVVRAVASF